tara:strand:- start:250 stop:666 length:417 start_codon:yes stop_codon:yes gene_type:complete
MKGLKTLIRLRKRDLDALRERLASLEGKKERLLQRIEQLHDELQNEIDLAGDMPEMRGFFGDFSKSIKGRQDKIVNEILRIETQIQQVTNDISRQFSELKKYEISYDNYLKEQARLEDEREQKELDEIGVQRYAHQDH